MTPRHLPLVTFAIWGAVTLASAQTPDTLASRQQQQQQLKKLSLEELMQIDVTLAGRREEPVGRAAAAITVLTGEDLRRSGVTTIADALRLAPGVHVARINGSQWAVSMRGFNAASANKLLVMIDGRTLYSPLFGGMFWNTIDYPIEDIDRIEVIRGPGGTLWGANAVNGVINIVTRHARDTRGGLVVLGAGNEDPALVTARYGGGTGAVAWRVHGKGDLRDNQRLTAGGSAGDPRRRIQAGVRLDASRGVNEWMFVAEALHADQRFSNIPDASFGHFAVQGSWHRRLAGGRRLHLQSYYRRESRDVPTQLQHAIDTVDVDVQVDGTLRRRHAYVVGGGYRLIQDETSRGGTVAFNPASRTYGVGSVFVQDDYAAIADRLYLTAGVKLEHNAFSGAEWQPSVRMRFHPRDGQLIWTAVSRAVRRPTRLDVDLIHRNAAGQVTVVGGGDAFRAETLAAVDAGYRAALAPRVSAEVVAFEYHYDFLRSLERPSMGPARFINGNSGRVRGLDLSANVDFTSTWRARASYTHQRVRLTANATGRPVAGGIPDANDPRHMFAVRNAWEFGRLEGDLIVRHVGALPFPRVPAYTEMDFRIGLALTERVNLALVGQDLLHPGHSEFPPSPTQPQTEAFERGVRGQLTIRF